MTWQAMAGPSPVQSDAGQVVTTCRIRNVALNLDAQIGVPNDGTVAGAKSCAFLLKGATNMAPLPIEVQLTAVNPDSATGFVSSVPSVVGAVASVTAGVTVTTNNDKTGYSLTQAFPTNFSALGISAGGAISTVTTVTTTTNLTNAATAGDFTAAMKTSLNAATPVASLSGDFTTTMKTSIGTAVAASAVASVTGNVGGNVVGSVASVTGAVGSVTAGVTVSTINAGVIDNASIATTAKQGIADALLDRDMGTGTDSGGRTVRNAFRVLRNKVDTVAGIVYKEDDTTTAFTFSITTAAGSPIVAVDPA